MLHVLVRLMVMPVALNAPPSVPDWIHELAEIPTLVGVEPRLVDGVTVIESASLPASAVPGVNVTSNCVEVSTLTVLGEAATLVTAVPLPLPIV
jgi:hypothetical protein